MDAVGVRGIRCPIAVSNLMPEHGDNDETQRYQLCHYDVVVAQLVALGFIKSV